MKNSLLIYLQYYVRYFPLNKGKNRLIRLLWRYLSGGQEQRITCLRQVPVRMQCDLSKHIQRDIFFWGNYHYEEQQLDFWVKYAQSSQVIFDVGANVGIYSLYAAKVNLQASVHAFEPTPEMANKLSENRALNNLANVVINKIAVGKADETGYVHLCKGDEGANEGMNFVTTEESQVCRPTAIRSLDSYCYEHNIPHIDLMKMDIEGGEYHALLGMQNLLSSKAIGCIFLELAEWAANRYGHTTAEIKTLLHSNGYQLYEISLGVLHPINPTGIHHGEPNIIAFAQTPQTLA